MTQKDKYKKEALNILKQLPEPAMKSAVQYLNFLFISGNDSMEDLMDMKRIEQYRKKSTSFENWREFKKKIK
jgi:hypothetical protein